MRNTEGSLNPKLISNNRKKVIPYYWSYSLLKKSVAIHSTLYF